MNNCTGQFECVNENGGFHCGCPTGYNVTSDGKNCTGRKTRRRRKRREGKKERKIGRREEEKEGEKERRKEAFVLVVWMVW